MAQRYAQAARRQPGDQVDPAIDLGRDRDDADVGRTALDLGKYLGAVELLFPSCSAFARAVFQASFGATSP